MSKLGPAGLGGSLFCLQYWDNWAQFTADMLFVTAKWCTMKIFSACRRPGAVLSEWDFSTASTPWRVLKTFPVVWAWNALTAYVGYRMFASYYHQFALLWLQ